MKDIHKGFTIAELVTAMVVIAMVVGITLPITINKMNKVDAVSYYLGYKTMIEISANVDLSDTTTTTEGGANFQVQRSILHL